MPRAPLQHVELLHSAVSALDDASLVGVHTASLRVIGSRLIHIGPHALA